MSVPTGRSAHWNWGAALLFVALTVACGSSPTAPAPSPTPTKPIPLTVVTGLVASHDAAWTTVSAHWDAVPGAAGYVVNVRQYVAPGAFPVIEPSYEGRTATTSIVIPIATPPIT